jgi:drug/metabolite transporter (DMT)-like permease
VIERLASRPRLAALAGAICIAFSGIFYRYAAVGPETGAVFRAVYGLPILALFAWSEARRHGPLPAATVRLALVAGIFFAADLVLWHHSIEWVGAGLATVLGNLQVVLVALAAWLLLGERPANRTLLALPVVLAGVVLISGVLGRGAYGANPLLGVLFGALTAVCYAGYLLVLRRGGRDLQRPAGPVAISTLASVFGTAGMSLLAGGFDPVPRLPAHAWLLALGVISQSFGSLFIAVSLPRLPAVLTSIILLAQPVTSVVLARILLDETPSLPQYAGVALVVGGIALATVPLERIRKAGGPAAAGEPIPGP